MSSENPKASNAGTQANLSMGGGPHMRMRVSAPGAGMCSATIWGHAHREGKGGEVGGRFLGVPWKYMHADVGLSVHSVHGDVRGE